MNFMNLATDEGNEMLFSSKLNKSSRALTNEFGKATRLKSLDKRSILWEYWDFSVQFQKTNRLIALVWARQLMVQGSK